MSEKAETLKKFKMLKYPMSELEYPERAESFDTCIAERAQKLNKVKHAEMFHGIPSLRNICVSLKLYKKRRKLCSVLSCYTPCFSTWC